MRCPVSPLLPPPSGLVMYTDSFYWEQRRGGFDEKTTDDFDVDPTGEYDRQRYGGGYVERTDGGEDHGRDTEGGGALEGTPCPVFYRDGSRSRKRARPPSITEQKRLFKHTVDRDVGGKLLRRLGWREGQPLGMRRGSEQGTVFPFERAAANRPRGRHGLGFGGGPPTHVAGAEAASSSDSEDGPDLAPSIAERRRQRFADPPLDKAFIGSTYGARRE